MRQALQLLGVKKLRSNLSPYFRRKFDAAAREFNLTGKNRRHGSCGLGSKERGTALLVTGGVRTMLHDEAVRDWVHTLDELRRHGFQMHAFVYLELRDSLARHLRKRARAATTHAAEVASHALGQAEPSMVWLKGFMG